MPTYFQRPENALKRANEFIDVGKKQPALDVLYDVIKSKKHRTWQKIHEPIMEKYLALCVELKKSHVAKEGLYQYKNICQQVNIKSLEDVVRKYLKLAESKTEAARQESHQVVVDCDDLDVIQTPESLLLSAVSGEDTQDRTDRAILTPWVKFLWESYRQCLELLRNNSSVEKLYQDTAQEAFKFCLKYGRKTEFRKLCDNLRTHLGHVHKYQHQPRAINLNNQESQAMHLETRLAQLESAIQMELWQEAFKAVEDIHGLIALSKKPPKPSLMANYYNKLGLVFWKSGSRMFHACAWHRLLILSREQRKNLSSEELTRLSSRVLCATLAVPITPSRNPIDRALEMDETVTEKQKRLATLLGLSSPPTRTSLLKDLVKFNIFQYVHPELQNMYHWLEVEFHPLKLSMRMANSLKFIEQKEDLVKYVPALQDITVTRLLKQVSQVYQTIEFARLASLAPFASPFHLERVIVDAAKNLDLQVRIDHRNRSLSFGTDLGVSQKEDVPEGPYLQSMPSEQIRNQLSHMAQALDKAIEIVQPRELQSKKDELRAHIVQSYRATCKKEHLRILQRRQIIEERKEELENMNSAREMEEQRCLEEQRQKQYEAEMSRLEQEAAERERQRKIEEHKEIQRRHAKERLDQLKQTALGQRVFKDVDPDAMAELDAEEIMAKQVEHLEKEKKELQDKLRAQEKKIDYFQRAVRLEEIPLLKEQCEVEKVQNREFFEEQEKERIEKLKAERIQAIANRDRLARIQKDKDSFLNKLGTSRLSVYKEKLVKFEKMLAEQRMVRLEERRQRRKEERRAKWVKEKQEEEQRRIDEEAKRQKEEAERLEREKREKEEEEYRIRMAKLEEQAEKQRQREKEIEEREARKRMEESGGRGRVHEDVEESRPWRREGEDQGSWRKGQDREGSDQPDGKWRPKVQSGGWRDREKAREERWRPSQRDVEHSRDDGPKGREEPDRERDLPPRDEERAWRGVSRDVRKDPDYQSQVESREAAREERGWRDRGDDRRPAGDTWRGRDGGGWRDRGSQRDDRGPRDERWRDERGGDRGGWRDRGRDERGPRDFGRDDRGPRDFDRGSYDDRFGRDDRGPRDDRPRRDDRFGRDDRGFDRPMRDDRGPRDFGRDGRGARDFGRDDRGPRERDFGRDERGPREFGRDDRGPSDFGRDGRGARDDHGPRDFDRGRDDKGGGGSWRDRARERDERGPREERGPRDRDDGGPRDSYRGPAGDRWRGKDSRGSPSKYDDRKQEPADKGRR